MILKLSGLNITIINLVNYYYYYTLNIPSSTQTTSHTQIKTIHTKIVHDYISSTHNKILSKQPPPIHESETTLDYHTRLTLTQLRSKNHLLSSHTSTKSHPYLTLHLHAHCQTHLHDTPHLFICPKISTTLSPEILWTDSVRMAELLNH